MMPSSLHLGDLLASFECNFGLYSSHHQILYIEQSPFMGLVVIEPIT